MMMNRRTFIAGSTSLAGLASLGACADGEQRLFQTAPEVLRRPIIDAHVHVFNASDLPAYEFIVQVFLEGSGRPLNGLMAEILREFAATVVDKAPDYAEEKRVLEGGQPAFPAGTFTAAVETGIRTGLLQLARKPDAAAQETLVTDDAPASTRKARPISPAEVISGIHWIAQFMHYRTARVREWSRFIGRTGHSRFAMPAMVDYGYALTGTDEPRTPFIEQVRLMGMIARSQPPGRIVHGFVPFNPWRFANNPSYVQQVLDEALGTQGFLGVKLYPSMGFQASGNNRLSPADFDNAVAPRRVRRRDVVAIRLLQGVRCPDHASQRADERRAPGMAIAR